MYTFSFLLKKKKRHTAFLKELLVYLLGTILSSGLMYSWCSRVFFQQQDGVHIYGLVFPF